jgi:DNA-binding response OmpR family regulator
MLLAESDPLLAKFLLANLRSAGFEVEHAAEGERALALAHEHRYDAMIVQAALQGLDGYELMYRIRLDDRLQSTPVILISARRQEEDVLRAFNAGADDFVPQPLNPLEIVARVRALLRRI